MWVKIGIGLFFLMSFIVGGDWAQIFIGIPVCLILTFGIAIIHEKIFKIDPMKNSSFLELLVLGVMMLGAFLLAFWLITNVIR
jgi:hypothetical protein